MKSVVHSRLDQLIGSLDASLRAVFGPVHASRRPHRAVPERRVDAPTLTSAERQESARLMRVNHCGEVCAQALYQGQALVAKGATVRAHLLAAANEERDHLAWCQDRLDDLGGAPSLAAPAFYAGSFAIGVASGLAGDRWSMGFLVETERQVEAHLDGHLQRISPNDTKSRAVIESMRDDEIRHGNDAEAAGAVSLPSPLKAAMRVFSKVMTETTARF
jgi:ubiquinone biosynthesis monooxygenase Coq7